MNFAGRSVCVGLALFIQALLSAAVAEQRSGSSTATGDGVVAGIVIDRTTGRGIAGAAVSISFAARALNLPTVVTDDVGRFRFERLPSGRYQLSATARGYLAGREQSGSDPPESTGVIELAERERRDVRIHLLKPARISGSILDDAAEPLEGVQVIALLENFVGGHRRFTAVASASSDDRGWYTVGRLAPGAYTIAVIAQKTTVAAATRTLFSQLSTAPAAERRQFEQSIIGSGQFELTGNGFRVGDLIVIPGDPGATTRPGAQGRLLSTLNLFYPGTPRLTQATTIALDAGTERNGVNVRVPLSTTVALSGRVVGPDGPVPHVTVRLIQDGAETLTDDYPFEQGLTLTKSDGTFAFAGVPSGGYSLKTYWLPPSTRPGREAESETSIAASSLSGQQEIAVGDSDVSDVTVTMHRGPIIRGRIVFDGLSQPPDPSRGVIRIELADGRVPTTPPMPPLRSIINPDGAFRSIGLPIGRYLLRIAGYEAWTLESAMLRDRDISDRPFDAAPGGDDIAGVIVTLTDTPARVSGFVRSPTGASPTGSSVIVFPRDSVHWIDYGLQSRRILRLRPGADGRFEAVGLPPGEYLALAIANEPPPDWSTSRFLTAAAPLATRVTVQRRTTTSLVLETQILRILSMGSAR